MRTRTLLWIMGAVAGVFGVLVVAGLPLYVFPPAEDIDDADLIFVIGPPNEERVAAERTLRSADVADLSLYSVTSRGRLSAEALAVCREATVTCAHIEPFTTKGEFAYLERFAHENDVERTVVLTFTPHVARTRYIAEKCFDGDVTVMAVDEGLTFGDWIYQYLYQSAAFVKAWATPCAEGAPRQ